MKKLVLVDFDRTLYKKDSLIEFTKFYKGNLQFYLGLIRLMPYLIQWKLKIITNEKAKKKYITYFFKNESYEVFTEHGNEFARNYIPKNLNKNVFISIQNHLNQNHNIYIVTASFSEWIHAWSSALKINIISTKFEIIDSKLTGNFKTKNCYGIEKINRIKEEINLDEFETIEVFGNGKGDYEMLKLRK